jgi:hypothetical protein
MLSNHIFVGGVGETGMWLVGGLCEVAALRHMWFQGVEAPMQMTV